MPSPPARRMCSSTRPARPTAPPSRLKTQMRRGWCTYIDTTHIYARDFAQQMSASMRKCTRTVRTSEQARGRRRLHTRQKETNIWPKSPNYMTKEKCARHTSRCRLCSATYTSWYVNIRPYTSIYVYVRPVQHTRLRTHHGLGACKQKNNPKRAMSAAQARFEHSRLLELTYTYCILIPKCEC
jgi:hypothetical protein